MENKNEYVILDITRNSYWKFNNFGYTKLLKYAKVFTKEQAIEKTNAPLTNDLVIIEYDKAGPFLEGFEIEMNI